MVIIFGEFVCLAAALGGLLLGQRLGSRGRR